MVKVIGISAHYHDAAASLVIDGVLNSAVQEERLTRIKFDPSFPSNAIRYCLDYAELSFSDIDAIAFYEDPNLKLNRILSSNGMGLGSPREVTRTLRQKLNPFFTIDPYLPNHIQKLYFSHHHSHAASAFFASGYNDAAILTVDGVGEWATTTLSVGESSGLTQLESIDFPDSLGLFYATITSFLGFQPNSDEYKVMGLASFGRPTLIHKMRRMLRIHDNGRFKLDPLFYNYNHKMYSPALSLLLNCPSRNRGDELLPIHADIAATAQFILEECLLSLTQRLYSLTGKTNLCLSGGVALNCVASARIRESSPFQNVFVQPASGDAGGSLGAAYLASASFGDHVQPMHTALLGPSFSSDSVELYLTKIGAKFHKLGREKLYRRCAELIANGFIVGWLQGRMEFGPRALGSRSILADPRFSQMQDKLNLRIKRREPFRPFAPVCLLPRANEFFESEVPEPYMTFVVNVREGDRLQAVTHADGTARLQTVEDDDSPLACLIREFAVQTGVPCLLNTSFNLAGEPIVCTPSDAFKCFREGNLDVLVLEDCLLIRSEQNPLLVSPGTAKYIEFARELKPFVRDTYSFT